MSSSCAREYERTSSSSVGGDGGGEGGTGFDGEAVGRDVIRLQRDGLFQSLAPAMQAQPGQTEHEINIHSHASFLPQHVHTRSNVFRFVLSSEGFEDKRIKTLRAQRDTRDTQRVPLPDFGAGERGGVRLKTPFLQMAEVQVAAQAIDEESEMRRGEHAGSASAEVESTRRGSLRQAQFCLRHHGLYEASHVCCAGCVFEEGTIRTHPVAEGDVDVDVLCCMHGCLCTIYD